MLYGIGLVLDGAILSLIVLFLERGEFPGWGPMIGIALGVGAVSWFASSLLPDGISLLGNVAGAAVGGLLLTWLCEMTPRRGLIAAGIYLGVRLVLGFLFHLLMK